MMIDKKYKVRLWTEFLMKCITLFLRLTVYLLLIRSLSKRAIWRVSWNDLKEAIPKEVKSDYQTA